MVSNIFSELNNQIAPLQVNLSKFSCLQDTSPLFVAIQKLPDMPMDWRNAGVAMAAAFFGAVAAFYLNWVHERNKKYDKQREKINKFIMRAGININRLACFKETFIRVEDKAYLNKLKDFIERFLTLENKDTFSKEWNEKIIPLLHEFNQKSPSFGGITKQWDKPSFLELNGEELFFVRGDTSDIIRLSEETNEQIRGIGRTIQAHNEMWDIAKESMKKGLSIENLGEFYHFITLNENIEDFINRSLSYSKYSMDKISGWWNENHKKKWWQGKNRDRCASFQFPSDILLHIPDPENYKNILYPQGDKNSKY